MEILFILFWVLTLTLIIIVFVAMFKFNKVWQLVITSPDFVKDDFLDSKFSCEWLDLIPKLNIDSIPILAKSLVLIVDDPDAPKWVWTHFIAFDIKTNWKDSLELFKDNKAEYNWIKRWINSANELTWHWPCPPKWHWVHRYIFKFYALNLENLELDNWVTKDELHDYMEPFILSFWEIVWKYKRD